MTYTIVEEEEESPEVSNEPTTYSFVEEEPVKEKKKTNTGPTKGSLPHLLGFGDQEAEYEAPVISVAKAAARGVGETAASFTESLVNKNPKYTDPKYAFGNKEELADIPKAIREALPEKSDEGFLKGVERVSKYASNPISLAFGAPGLVASTTSGLAGQLVEEAGGGEGLQTLAEIVTPSWNLIKTLAQKSKETIPAVAKKIGGWFSKAEVKSTPHQVEQRMQSIGKEAINRLQVETAENAKPFSRGEFNAKEIANDLEDVTINRQLNAISPAIATKQEFGNRLVGSVEKSFDEAKASYDRKYAIIKANAPYHKTKSESLIRMNDKLIEEINGLETKPPDYQKMIDTINDINADLGKKVNLAPKNQILDIHGNPISQAEKVTYEKVPISKKIELSKRINQIINYDLAEYNIKDRLKPIAKLNNLDIQRDLTKVDPLLGQTFAEAQKEFGQTADKFGRASIAKLRKAEATEKAAAIIKSPTSLEDLKAIVPSEEYAVIERQVLEELKGMSAESAKKTLKELSPHLSQEAKIAGENIVEFKDAQFFKGKWNKHANAILDELQEAFTTGTRPNSTLKLMQTREGYKTIYETLHNTPTGKKALGYLQKQYIDDMVATSLKKDGTLDWQKLGNILDSNQTNKIIVRQSLGKKGLVEFEKFAEYGRNIAANFERYGPSVKGEGILKGVKKHATAAVVPAIGLITGGLPYAAAGATAVAVGKLSTFLVRRLLASSKAQAAFRELANPTTWKNGNAERVAQSLMLEAAKES